MPQHIAYCVELEPAPDAPAVPVPDLSGLARDEAREWAQLLNQEAPLNGLYLVRSYFVEETDQCLNISSTPR